MLSCAEHPNWHSKGGPVLLALIGSDTGGTDVGRKWWDLGGLRRSPQCTRRTRNSAVSFRLNSAAQGNTLLNLNEVASHVLDLLVKIPDNLQEGVGERCIFLWSHYMTFPWCMIFSG